MGEEAFESIISGFNLKKFMAEFWEKQPMCIVRENENHYDHLKVSRKTIDEMLRTNIIEYTKNVDVTAYKNGKRETYNPGKRVELYPVYGQKN